MKMTENAVRILIVDDEPPIRKLLRVGLSAQAYAVSEAMNAKVAMELAVSDKPDLIILDLGLPDMSGHDLLAKWRGEGMTLPIVILSSRTDEAGIVKALELGADDYVTKPFGMNELGARIRVALRHRLQAQGEKPAFQTGELSVDLVKRIVKVAGRDVKLSPKEYDILRILVQHAGKVLTHRFLLEHVWDGLTDVQYLRVYVRQLRQKIEATPDQPRYILTETGVGYRLAAPD
ncbi:KDP operon transcriptional regulatory protein KdpE [compost metagenome]